MTIPDVAACIAAVKLLTKSGNLVKKLWKNADYLRSELKNSVLTQERVFLQLFL